MSPPPHSRLACAWLSLVSVRSIGFSGGEFSLVVGRALLARNHRGSTAPDLGRGGANLGVKKQRRCASRERHLCRRGGEAKGTRRKPVGSSFGAACLPTPTGPAGYIGTNRAAPNDTQSENSEWVICEADLVLPPSRRSNIRRLDSRRKEKANA